MGEKPLMYFRPSIFFTVQLYIHLFFPKWSAHSGSSYRACMYGHRSKRIRRRWSTTKAAVCVYRVIEMWPITERPWTDGRGLCVNSSGFFFPLHRITRGRERKGTWLSKYLPVNLWKMEWTCNERERRRERENENIDKSTFSP